MADGHTIKWFWIRHAPATMHGRFCGRSDPPLDNETTDKYRAIAHALPKGCRAFASPLLRARRTLDRLIAAGFTPGNVVYSTKIAEQNFGSMEGKPYADVGLPDGADALAAWRPEDGESFTDVCARVRQFAADVGRDHTAENICLVSHAGAIRAALTLAHGLSPAEGLGIAVEPLSLTHLSLSEAGDWTVHTSNRTFEEALAP